MPRTVLVLALALLGCSPDKDASTGDVATTTGTTTGDGTSEAPTTSGFDGVAAGCPGHPRTDACCCFEENPGPQGGKANTSSACGGQPLCPVMELACDSLDDSCDNPITEDVTAIDCILQALANGASGQVAWAVVGGGGLWVNYVSLDLV
ncbi:MAG TPA: hypothetical protein VGB85_24270, partial [Nannocystis sp.]